MNRNPYQVVLLQRVQTWWDVRNLTRLQAARIQGCRCIAVGFTIASTVDSREQPKKQYQLQLRVPTVEKEGG